MIVVAAALMAACGAAPPSTPDARTVQASPRPADPAASRARSDDDAKLLFELEARFEPEDGSAEGVDARDEAITDLGPNLVERASAAYREAERALVERRAREKDPDVRADLDILIRAAQLKRERIELEDRYLVPFIDVAGIVFEGMTSLLDDRVPEARRRAALVRLRKYAGMEPGQAPLTDLAMQRIRARLEAPGLLFPPRAKVEKALANAPRFADGIEKLLAKYALAGYQEPLARWRSQLVVYTQFLREAVLPRARADFRQPPELYGLSLEERGIDAPPREVAARAHRVFAEVQREMQALAPRVARERGIAASDYRDVIRALKKEQIEGDALLALYRQRIGALEEIIRREHLVRLPARGVRIRMATEAESGRINAPFFMPPRILGNTGEEGELVLPARSPADPAKRLDDFSYPAASWALAAHEGRPGHDLQYAIMVEKKLTLARAVFADNSTNAEGWGLYAEELVRPYLPPDGQLVDLQFRLMRAAHAFLDIELNLGLTTREEARRVLMEDAVFSQAWADQCLERYTFIMPAQAPSYFYGFMRLSELRADTERAMGARFNQEAFHEFVLAQGLAPPASIRRAVFEQFVSRGG